MSEATSSEDEETVRRQHKANKSASGHKSKRHKSSNTKFRHVAKLLTLAAEGQHRKISKLIDRHENLDINSYNSQGFTALHQVLQFECPTDFTCINSSWLLSSNPYHAQAARFGHEKAVKILLQ